MSLKRHPRHASLSLHLLGRFLIKYELQNGAPNRPKLESFFTWGPKRRPGSHLGPLLDHFGCPEALFWAHWGPLFRSEGCVLRRFFGVVKTVVVETA